MMIGYRSFALLVFVILSCTTEITESLNAAKKNHPESVLLPAYTSGWPAPAEAPKDSILHTEKKRIHGNTYYLMTYNDGGWRTGLKIACVTETDSFEVYDGDHGYRSGNCNVTTYLVVDYEIRSDSMLVCYYEEFIDHFDEMNPVSFYSTWRETYVIQKKGPIVRLKTEYGKDNPELQKEIEEKLANRLSEASDFYD